MGEAPRRVTPGYAGVRALLLALAVLAPGCAGPVHDLYPPRAGESVTPVWVVNHGWHTGIVVRRQDVPEGLWPQLRDFADSDLVEVGWGDRDFYMAPAGTSGMALKAALWPGSSVLHVAGFSGPPGRSFPVSDIVEVRLSRGGFEKLAAFIQDAYATDEAGGAIRLGPGQHSNSRFYLARERYHALKTCNVWTARALRAGGCPVTPLYAVTAGNVMYQAAAFCGGADDGPRSRPANDGVDAALRLELFGVPLLDLKDFAFGTVGMTLAALVLSVAARWPARARRAAPTARAEGPLLLNNVLQTEPLSAVEPGQVVRVAGARGGSAWKTA